MLARGVKCTMVDTNVHSNRESKPPRVLSAMSGGVDSSVATALLSEQGFEVIGSMLRFWSDDRPADAFNLCCSPEAAYDARRIADRLEVPFYLLDHRKEFDEIVVEPFVPTYLRGETPNPCVWCNRFIKFGSLIQKARMLDCEFMATGHYVRRIEGFGGPELHRGFDRGKDQTYFLWALPREILTYLLFPLGELNKTTVRKLARERGLETAEKPGSSGLCFVTDSVRRYLDAETEPNPGPVIDAESGDVVGEHKGIQYYTIGQKRHLGLYQSHLSRYVLGFAKEGNAVFVGTREMCRWDYLEARQANYLIDVEALPRRVMAQVRYRQSPLPATIVRRWPEGFELRFDEPVFAVTIGQSAVLYEGDRLLGGGVITLRDRTS
jgi:tRNA-specific 2-thiouridylase